MELFATLRNAWRIKDIRRKLLFTLAMLLVYRLGSFVPIPGIDSGWIRENILGGEQAGGGLFGLFNVFTGGALSNFSVFAMGIMPYINSSIIVNLLQAVIPKFEEWAKEGAEGRKKLTQVTRYGTIILGLIQAIGMSLAFRQAINISKSANPTGYYVTLVIMILSLTAGTSFLMWLGEKITEKGIGNGISMIIFASIISRLPMSIIQAYALLKAGEISIINILVIAVLAILVIAGMVYVSEGERRIPVQYSKRVIGRKMYGGASTHIPLKVNQAGVIPVIFATSLLMLPQTIGQFWDNKTLQKIAAFFSLESTWSGKILATILIIFFAYFYTAITVNPAELADNIRKNGGFIPGIRAGRSTSEYISRILNRITLVGALFLAVIVVLPYIFEKIVGMNIGIGGTSLLIVIGVALETMKQIESQMLMRHYKGFM
ncbi:MAG: preprotein translocase subunit SecY [Bacillota bacterium]|jgi:preprotein translocase subunit SecY|nr:preprotein translocase subunit SecY [Bacillota bacterium]